MGKRAIISFVLFFFLSVCLWAGGWNNTLMGCRALALGGFTGVADDPSAIFYNPAGLVFQKQNFNFTIGGFHIWPTHEYVLPDGSRAQSKYTSSVPQVFLSYRTSDKITIGFGAYVPYAGGGIDWKREDLGVPFKTVLGVYSLTPTIAYQVSEKLSFGFNLNLYRGVLDINTEIAPQMPMKAEESGSALSAGFGLMFRPNEKMGIGLDIRGPAKMKLSGTTSLPVAVPGMGTVTLDFISETRFDLPWDVEVGVSYKLADNLLFSTSAQYTMWSALDKVEKTIKDIPFTGTSTTEEKMDFKNILIWRTGVEYVLPQGIALRAAFGFDRSATPKETLDFKNIDVDKFTLLGGIGYQTGKMQIDFVYIYANGKEREKEQTGFGFPLTEKYNLNVLILGLGVTFSF
jgi:long-chain fatty acid transport protein